MHCKALLFPFFERETYIKQFPTLIKSPWKLSVLDLGPRTHMPKGEWVLFKY
jgi:hypothetical protein